jgi:hypothetical protein
MTTSMHKFLRFGAETVGAIAVYQTANNAYKWGNEQLLSNAPTTWKTDDIDASQIRIALTSVGDVLVGLTAVSGYYSMGHVIRHLWSGYPMKYIVFNIKPNPLSYVKKVTLMKSLPIFVTINAVYIGSIVLATSKSRLKTTPSCGSSFDNHVINENIYDPNHIMRRLLINPVIDEYFFHFLLFSRLIPIAGAGMAHVGSSLALACVQHNRPSETRASVIQCSNTSQFLSNFMDSMFLQSMYFFTGRMIYPVLHHICCNALYWWCEEGAMFKVLEHSYLWKKYIQRKVKAANDLPAIRTTSEENHTIDGMCEKWIRAFATDGPSSTTQPFLTASHTHPIALSPLPIDGANATYSPYAAGDSSLHMCDARLTRLCSEDSVDFVYSVLNVIDKLRRDSVRIEETSATSRMEDKTRLSRHQQEHPVKGVSLDMHTMEQLDSSYSVVINYYPNGMSLQDMTGFIKQQLGTAVMVDRRSGLSIHGTGPVNELAQEMESIEQLLQVSIFRTALAHDQEDTGYSSLQYKGIQDAELVELIDKYYTTIAQSQLMCAELLRSRVSSAALAGDTSSGELQSRDSEYARAVTSAVLPLVPQVISASGPSTPYLSRHIPVDKEEEQHDLHIHTLLATVARRSAVEYLGNTCGLTVRRFGIVQQRGSERSPQVAAVVKKWEDYFSGKQYRDDMLKQFLQRD